MEGKDWARVLDEEIYKDIAQKYISPRTQMQRDRLHNIQKSLPTEKRPQKMTQRSVSYLRRKMGLFPP
jgi:hypothetical protein